MCNVSTASAWWNVPGCFNAVCLSTPVELIASHCSQMSYENICRNERGGERGVDPLEGSYLKSGV